MKQLYILAFLVLSIGLYGQNKPANIKISSTKLTPVISTPAPVHSTTLYSGEKCLTHELDEQLLQNNAYRIARESAKNLTKQKIQEAQINRAAPPVYTIPVVFHVIHKGEAVGSVTNVTDAQLMSAIDALNRDYRRTNADGGIALGVGPDTEIQFCLASKDPAGNAHSGINRVNGTSVTNYASQGITTGGNETQVKNLSKWDNRYYLNIWVVSEINDQGSDVANINTFTGGTIGYAYLPINPTSNTNDGIVILHCSVGNDPNNNTPGFRMWPATLTGRTLTHEVGHYLGLQHPFDNTTSCTETNCNTQGDEICDTPPTQGGNDCAGPDCPGSIVENYMDYTDESCQDMFTAGQSTVMRAVLAGVRNDLVNTTNCTPTSVIANFAANTTTVTTGGTVTFTDLSTGGVMTSWSWTFGGGGTPNTSTAQNPTITFNTPGTYTVSLLASDGSTSDTETKTSYITVSNFNPLVCDTITNIDYSTDVLEAYGVGAWGAYPGHNSLGINAYAEPFYVTSATEVQKVILPILQADNGTVGSSIDVVVYADNAGKPGAVLGSQNRLITALNAGYYNLIAFNTPVSVTGNFWVGVEVNNGVGDTVVFATAEDRSPSADSTAFLRTAGGVWYSANYYFGIATSLYLDVLTSGSPGVSFTETSLAVNPGNAVTFDASNSTNYSDILWNFVSGSPTSSTNVSQVVTYNTLGTHNVTLYLLGGCRVDSLVKQVVVSNTTNVIENELSTNISVYPNPTNDLLNVIFNDKLSGNATVEMIDANGRIITVLNIPEIKNYTQTIDVNSVAKGIYQLRVRNNSLVTNKKIVIN